jgi:hypothetical protein
MFDNTVHVLSFPCPNKLIGSTTAGDEVVVFAIVIVFTALSGVYSAGFLSHDDTT